MGERDWFYNFFLPGGNIVFWFLNPATIAFAIPLYRRNDIFKKYWIDVVLTLFVGGFISLFGIHMVSKLFGLSKVSIAAMLPQAATTAVAMPIAKSIGGDPAVTAMVCIINAVIISKVGLGLGLGTSGHTVGSAKAVQLGSIQGAMASVSVVIVALAMDILVPIYARLFL